MWNWTKNFHATPTGTLTNWRPDLWHPEVNVNFATLFVVRSNRTCCSFVMVIWKVIASKCRLPSFFGSKPPNNPHDVFIFTPPDSHSHTHTHMHQMGKWWKSKKKGWKFRQSLIQTIIVAYVWNLVSNLNNKKNLSFMAKQKWHIIFHTFNPLDKDFPPIEKVIGQ